MSSQRFLRSFTGAGWAALLAVVVVPAPGLARAQASAVMIAPPLQLVGAKARKTSHRKPTPAGHVLAHRPVALPANAIVMRTVRTMAIDPAPTGSVAAAAIPVVAAPQPELAKAAAPAAPQGEVDVKAFCGNVGRAASDARVAWQAANLVELEAALKKRIDEMEAKTSEHREWLARRDEAMRRAEDSVVAIYQKMRPDAAAAQIAALDDAMAAAILTKLSPRSASAILSEVPATRAARLTDAIAGARAPLTSPKGTS